VRGKVGTDGNTGERQAQATLAALDSANTCSTGFLRKDALTVVVVITDEDDDWSEPDVDLETDAQAWFDGVVAAEDGIESNVVFLLISGGSPKWPDCGPLDLMTMTGADDSPKLTAWAQKFSHANTGSVCSSGYGSYLAESIAVIETACDEFEPIP
jgi:IMP cyclohydrolase